jgi:sterol desaturase/sphingolipid hydroxylase (fatty acid hydroxylase superfamily)
MTMPWPRIEADAFWIVFAAGFLLVGIWESIHPFRNLSAGVARRWGGNGTVVVAASILSLLLFRASPTMVAIAVANSRFGLLNKSWQPYWMRFAFAIILLDLLKYAVHRSFHAIPFLWRVHHVHHSDPDLDLSTGARTHPIEVILIEGASLAAVAILAPPAAAALTVGLLSMAQSFFSHANSSLPGWLENPLRQVLVTPDMHRIHHSEEVPEQSKNFADTFSWWDRLFHTYLEAPAAGQDRIRVGLKGFQNNESLNPAFMLLHPFRRQEEEATSQETPVMGLE